MAFIVNIVTLNRQEHYLLENHKAGVFWQFAMEPLPVVVIILYSIYYKSIAGLMYRLIYTNQRPFLNHR